MTQSRSTAFPRHQKRRGTFGGKIYVKIHRNATITKHSPPEASKEGEVKHIQWQNIKEDTHECHNHEAQPSRGIKRTTGEAPEQAKNIGPTQVPNGYLYGSYMGNS